MGRHFEVQPALRGDFRIPRHAQSRDGHLVLNHCLIKRHDHHVVEVEPFAGVVKNAHDVCKVIQLMLREELVLQIERSKYHGHLRHVVVIFGRKRVVLDRQVGPGGIQEAQVGHAAGAVYVR